MISALPATAYTVKSTLIAHKAAKVFGPFYLPNGELFNLTGKTTLSEMGAAQSRCITIKHLQQK